MHNKANELHEKGISAYHSGELELAERDVRTSIELDPRNPNAHINLASILIARGRHAAALLSLSKATELEDKIGIAHYLKAVVFKEMGNTLAAIQSVNIALHLDPASIQALLLRGSLLSHRGDASSATKDYRAAIKLDSQNALAHFNLACTLHSQNDLDNALIEYDRALASQPDFTEALCNKANALRDLMRLNDAQATYNLAVELSPNNNQLLWNLGLLQLQQGDYHEGWKNYEHRLTDTSNPEARTTAPRWDGVQSLHGRSILVIGEQGLGDMIQFSRYLPPLCQLGAQVTVQVPDSLIELLNHLPGVNTISMTETPPETDFYCLLMSLPFAFKTVEETIPSANGPYLQPTPPCVAKWDKLLGDGERLRIGLVTRGNPQNPRDGARRIQFEDLARKLPKIAEYYLLHDELQVGDVLALADHPHINSLHENIKNFNDTAAACLHMDLVISVDTSVAHLAGALGVATWVLIPFASDWRWLLDRTDSPWYPKVRLFRQVAPRQWAEVLDQVGAELATTISSRAPRMSLSSKP